MKNVFVVNIVSNIGECKSYVELYDNQQKANRAFKKYIKKINELFRQYDYVKMSETKDSYQIATQDSSFAFVTITNKSIK